KLGVKIINEKEFLNMTLNFNFGGGGEI
ncbi:MAG: hypothetical protein US65_C0003G0001, partial [Candidatus Yanofskybacteria bacterium GW2011_GWC2_37_9]